MRYLLCKGYSKTGLPCSSCALYKSLLNGVEDRYYERACCFLLSQVRLLCILPDIASSAVSQVSGSRRHVHGPDTLHGIYAHVLPGAGRISVTGHSGLQSLSARTPDCAPQKIQQPCRDCGDEHCDYEPGHGEQDLKRYRKLDARYHMEVA